MDCWAGDPALGVDPQKKMVGATERDEQARRAYRAEVAAAAVDAFVIVDECGSNINLTRFTPAPPKVNERSGVEHAIPIKIRPSLHR